MAHIIFSFHSGAWRSPQSQSSLWEAMMRVVVRRLTRRTPLTCFSPALAGLSSRDPNTAGAWYPGAGLPRGHAETVVGEVARSLTKFGAFHSQWGAARHDDSVPFFWGVLLQKSANPPGTPLVEVSLHGCETRSKEGRNHDTMRLLDFLNLLVFFRGVLTIA